jgi:hypothetical protein
LQLGERERERERREFENIMLLVLKIEEGVMSPRM